MIRSCEPAPLNGAERLHGFVACLESPAGLGDYYNMCLLLSSTTMKRNQSSPWNVRNTPGMCEDLLAIRSVSGITLGLSVSLYLPGKYY